MSTDDELPALAPQSNPRVLVVDDEDDLRALYRDLLTADGMHVRVASNVTEAEAELRAGDVDVVLSDLMIGNESGLDVCARTQAIQPSTPVVIATGFGSMDAVVGALRAGASDFLQKPIDPDLLLITIRRAAERAEVVRELERLREPPEGGRRGEIIGRSPRLMRAIDDLDRVADTDLPVLITGESGTGKELAARALHRMSGRRGRFVAVNCGAIPEDLIESHLFGHVRGAFTGAHSDRDGVFVSAHLGTLFLDEIGEMPASAQVKLLRALQERSVVPVGGTREIAFDTRVVSATHQDVDTDVRTGALREDLYYRLAVLRVHLPPLREREGDVLALASHFITVYADRTGRDVSGLEPDAARQLLAYDWPGNVRELENCVARAVALARYETIRLEDLPPSVRDHEVDPLSFRELDEAALPDLATLERRYIEHVLDRFDGNKTAAARALGIDRRTLHRKVVRWDESEGDDA